MADKYINISNKELLSMCFWWIEDLRIHEDFVGYYQLPDIKSDNIVTATKNYLIRMQLYLNNLSSSSQELKLLMELVTCLAKILVFLSKLQLNSQQCHRPTVKGFKRISSLCWSSFRVHSWSCTFSTLMIFLMMLSVILLIILVTTPNVIRHLICGNN